MLMDKYFEAMKNVLIDIEKTQKEKIVEVSEEIAKRLSKGAAWHIMDTGHMKG